MEIPPYQIHAVLSSLICLLSRQACEQGDRSRSAENHRLQGVIERVSCSIIERITLADVTRAKNGCREHMQSKRSEGEDPPHFQFSVLDENGRRRRRTIPIEAASLMLETDADPKKTGTAEE